DSVMKQSQNMFSTRALVLLCLIPLSASAPLTCEDLTRPLDHLDRHHLEGQWVLVASSFKAQEHEERFKDRNSATIYFANASDTSSMSFTRVFRFNESCQYFNTNVSVEGSGFNIEQLNITISFMYTSCPDCLVMRFYSASKRNLPVNLLSRRVEVEQTEMEEFKAQVECLKTLPPVVMDPTQEHCPEQPTGDTEAPKA
uniref:Apolipoprotein M n=1 Tax=Sphaeramia orbicularis TaxID=375764 RepID=A0A673D1B9_9TELE